MSVVHISLLKQAPLLQLLEETGNGRDINRHFYSVEEAKQALDKPVVKALLDLCRFRNQHPAFNGEASLRAFLSLQMMALATLSMRMDCMRVLT